MARRRRKRQSGLEALIEAPWPAGFILGIIGFFGVRYGIGWVALMSGNAYLVPMTEPIREGALAPLAWLVLGVCWLASAISFFKRERSPLIAKALPRRREPSASVPIAWFRPEFDPHAHRVAARP